MGWDIGTDEASMGDLPLAEDEGLVGYLEARPRRLEIASTVPICVFLLWVLLALSSCQHDEVTTSRASLPQEPHPIIILDIDTLRADHLGCYGYERPTSPNIDAFAQEAVLFEWAFAPAPNTLPSQTTILSSLYPSTHGVFEASDKISEGTTLLAEVLSQNGFRTAAFADGGFLSRSFGFAQGFEVFDSRRGGLKRSGPLVLDWVREHATENFFLLVHTYDVHAPYDPPEPYRSLFADESNPPSPDFEPTVEALVKVRKSMFTENPQPLSGSDLAFAVARYDGGIRYVDDWIGTFMSELERLELKDRATIIVLSDHGEEFQEHGSVGHEKLYATVTRIPLMIRFPGARPARRIEEVVAAVDVMPTVLDLLGIDIPSTAQGKSLLPLVLSQATGHHLAFGESNYFGKRRFVALDDHRLLYTERDGRTELFEFRQDPHELFDLAAADPERADELRRLLLRWRRGLAEASNQAVPESSELDPELTKQLEALGYLD